MDKENNGVYRSKPRNTDHNRQKKSRYGTNGDTEFQKVIIPIPVREAGIASGRRTNVYAAVPRKPGFFSWYAAAIAIGRDNTTTPMAIIRLWYNSPLAIITELVKAANEPDANTNGYQHQYLKNYYDAGKVLQQDKGAGKMRGCSESG